MKNSTKLTKGQVVKILPEWQDAGDDEFTIKVVEDRGNRVSVAFHKEGESIVPRECIDKYMLEEVE